MIFSKAYKLKLFFKVCGIEVYEDPVHLFYSNLRVSRKSGELETLVLSTRIVLDDSIFEEVLEINSLGGVPYMNFVWPDDFEVSFDGAKKAISESGTDFSDFSPLSL